MERQSKRPERLGEAPDGELEEAAQQADGFATPLDKAADRICVPIHQLGNGLVLLGLQIPEHELKSNVGPFRATHADGRMGRLTPVDDGSDE